jgi:uncharacterized protein (DUF1330 family)
MIRRTFISLIGGAAAAWPLAVSSEDKRLTVVEFENMEKAQATFASPSYNEVRTLGNKYAKFRIVAAEGPSQ